MAFPQPFVWAEKHPSKNANSGKSKKRDKDYVWPTINFPTEPSIKFVKKANAWCKTWYDSPHRTFGSRIVMTQKQEWTAEKPSVQFDILRQCIYI